MHGKTQVFPLPESDTTHTRLTHSLECASVGRSLGCLVGESLEKRGEFNAAHEVGSVVSAAALVHDIGNPPFGHSGEDAIGYFFESEVGAQYLEGLSACETTELRAFEGNALGFRILTRQKPTLTTNPGGLGLTVTTLATFSKYPCVADVVDKRAGVARKKFGLFADDLGQWLEIADVLGLESTAKGVWSRHPLAFLLEAADDICYRIMDIEDGYRLGIIDEEFVQQQFLAIARECDQDVTGRERILLGSERIGYLRAKAINSLIQQCGACFLEAEESILDGTHAVALLKAVSSDTLRALDHIEEQTVKRLYKYRSVLEIEAAGFEVLPRLLEQMLGAALSGQPNARNRKIKELIPLQYLHNPDRGCGRATQILDVCEFVASMTDSYAIDMYRAVFGIELPNYS